MSATWVGLGALGLILIVYGVGRGVQLLFPPRKTTVEECVFDGGVTLLLLGIMAGILVLLVHGMLLGF